jgi:hypothetical protein
MAHVGQCGLGSADHFNQTSGNGMNRSIKTRYSDRERNLKRHNDPNWLYYGDDHWYKIRTVFQASKRLQEALDIRQKLMDGPWQKWFDEASAAKHFYGLTKDDYTIYEVDGEGYSHNTVSRKRYDRDRDLKKIIQMAENVDLPLMLEDPKYQTHKTVVESLLKGTMPAIIHREDLIKEHDRLELRLEHMRFVIGTYRAFIKDYAHRKFSDLIYDKYRRSLILVLTVEGHLYHYYNGRAENLELADNIEYYTVTADEKCHEIKAW